jgi:hypothetical protein
VEGSSLSLAANFGHASAYLPCITSWRPSSKRASAVTVLLDGVWAWAAVVTTMQPAMLRTHLRKPMPFFYPNPLNEGQECRRRSSWGGAARADEGAASRDAKAALQVWPNRTAVPVSLD